MSNTEEEMQDENKKATKEDVIELAESMGINRGTCSWDNPVNKFVIMLNTLFMNTLASERVNQDCLMILVGQPIGQLKAIKESYDAFKNAEQKQRDYYKTERTRKEEWEEKYNSVKWKNRHIQSTNRFARVIAQMALDDASRLSYAISEANHMFSFDDE